MCLQGTLPVPVPRGIEGKGVSMEIMGYVIEDCVSRGIELLDKYGPEDWRDLIDRETYHHHDVLDCILGQVYGSYFGGKSALEDAITEAGEWEDLPECAVTAWCCADCDHSLFPRYFGFDGTDEMNRAFEEEWRKRLWGPTVPEAEEC